jgi:hypothetical protein
MGADGWAICRTVYVLTFFAFVLHLLSPGVYSSQCLMSGVPLIWRGVKQGGRAPKALSCLAIVEPLHCAARSVLRQIYQDFEWDWVLAQFN